MFGINLLSALKKKVTCAHVDIAQQIFSFKN